MRKALYLLFGVIYYLYTRLVFVDEQDLPEEVQELKRQGNPNLFAHWHGDELLMVGVYAFRNMTVMVSSSKDGEIMATILGMLGFRIVRGSSDKSPVRALLGLLNRVKKTKDDVSLAVDGPKGPRHVVKPGVILLAKKLGVPIIPAAANANRKYIFKNAWNKTFLPYPFSRGIFLYGNPVFVPQDADDNVLEEKRLELENSLKSLKEKADQHFQN